MKKLVFVFVILLAIPSCREDNEPVADPAFVYFLVGETDIVHNDSYILALKDPGDIAQARAIVDDPDNPKIIMAEITKNKSENYYVNKDLTGGKTWSWHVSRFVGFADFSAEIYDGWPAYVEEHYDEWVENTKAENGKGVIGFWNYTVIREVDKSELY